MGDFSRLQFEWMKLLLIDRESCAENAYWNLLCPNVDIMLAQIYNMKMSQLNEPTTHSFSHSLNQQRSSFALIESTHMLCVWELDCLLKDRVGIINCAENILVNYEPWQNWCETHFQLRLRCLSGWVLGKLVYWISIIRAFQQSETMCEKLKTDSTRQDFLDRKKYIAFSLSRCFFFGIWLICWIYGI